MIPVMTYGKGILLSSRRILEMHILVLALILVHLPSACLLPENLPDSVSCTQDLGCQLLAGDVLCTQGEAVPMPELDPVLVLTEMKTRTILRCQQEQDCVPCVQVMLHLGLLGVKQDGRFGEAGAQPTRHHKELLRMHVWLSAQTYPSFRCVLMEVWLPRTHNSSLGSLQFDCFPIALSGELRITAFTNPFYESVPVLNHTHYGPNCNWHKAKDNIQLCQVPSLEVFSGAKEAVLQVWDFPVPQPYHLWLYLNQTQGRKGLNPPKELAGPENVSIPLSKVFPCLCLQIWPKTEDPPRTDLCPFARDTEALARAWAQSQLKLTVVRGTLSLLLSAPCELPGELVPCWKGDQLACYPLHSRLHLTLTPNEIQEFPGLRPHPNLCVQVRSNRSIRLQSCLQEDLTRSQQQLLLWETVSPQGNSSFCLLEQGSWVPIAQAISTRNTILREALQNDMKSGDCLQVWHSEDSETDMLWACSLQKYSRTHWGLAWMMALLGVCCILLVLLLRKETLKGWLRILNEDYSSGGMLQRRPVLILYSPDNARFERLAGILAAALTQLHLSVSLELWSRAELGSLGPMQWLHAQRQQVLQGGGTIVLLFSHGAVAGCAEWLGWEEKGTLPPVHTDGIFLASLNCVMPDFLAGKARDNYMVACFEELLPVAEIPRLFHSVPIYQLPSQLFSFLLALAGPGVGHEQRNGLRRHVAWIGKSLERAVEECQQKKPSWQHSPLLPPQPGDAQMKGTNGCPCTES
ncbi:interleukin-17 receptor C [Eublepharis macularius]|uniref:Interleukin-17 receptor C n=1 Tax=Eublepharis macularius TaxID=481883 RepID=A0AA97KXD8_EUBMA|nr:interleukin-17 receptor C [Eublepharis macularius]